MTTSVLVNTHNHGPFIEAAVASLLTQTVPPDEIIVYDDASTDDTVSRLRRQGDRLIVIAGGDSDRPNFLRQANAVQTAFARSTGRLVFLLDGDDCFKPAKIEHHGAALAAHPDAALIQAPMDKIDPQGRPLGDSREPRKHVTDHLQRIYRLQDVDFYYPTSALAFSRAYLERVLPLDFSDGLPLWIDTRLGMFAPFFGRVITLPDTHTEWRRHPGSDSLGVRSRQLAIRQTLMRARVFNGFCRRHGLPTISPWRNRRFYLQLVRRVLPESAYGLYHDHLRPRFSHAR